MGEGNHISIVAEAQEVARLEWIRQRQAVALLTYDPERQRLVPSKNGLGGFWGAPSYRWEPDREPTSWNESFVDRVWREAATELGTGDFSVLRGAAAVSEAEGYQGGWAAPADAVGRIARRMGVDALAVHGALDRIFQWATETGRAALCCPRTRLVILRDFSLFCAKCGHRETAYVGVEW